MDALFGVMHFIETACDRYYDYISHISVNKKSYSVAYDPAYIYITKPAILHEHN